MNVAADGVVIAIAVPLSNNTSFLKLELHGAGGRLVSDNFYWIPTTLAQLDWANSTYYYTPATTYADMRDLAQLPNVALQGWAERDASGDIRVKLSNAGNSVAFFVRLRAVKDGGDEDIAPVLWDDNYVSVLPGESKRLLLKSAAIDRQAVKILVDGWNVSPQTLRVATSGKGAHPWPN